MKVSDLLDKYICERLEDNNLNINETNFKVWLFHKGHDLDKVISDPDYSKVNEILNLYYENHLMMLAAKGGRYSGTYAQLLKTHYERKGKLNMDKKATIITLDFKNNGANTILPKQKAIPKVKPKKKAVVKVKPKTKAKPKIIPKGKNG